MGAAKILVELSCLFSSSYGRRAAGGGALDGKVAMSRPKASPGKKADSIRTKKNFLSTGRGTFIFFIIDG